MTRADSSLYRADFGFIKTTRSVSKRHKKLARTLATSALSEDPGRLQHEEHNGTRALARRHLPDVDLRPELTDAPTYGHLGGPIGAQEPASLVMERKILRGIKERAERLARHYL